ncbi:cyclic peptide export ABC transporter [Aquimarina longa]|uniref:cyclic peptide export ABC transporter n=1 Tax=Aquimarina longa TaxID=1080221 RepID=UPI0007858B6C|nr:cyclic peptide export ABC transporter [Aquimarina longa]
MRKVTLLNLLRVKIKVALPILGFIAVINGLWSGSLLMLVSHKIAGTPLPLFDDYDWLVYLFFVVGSFFLTYYFNGYMIKATLNFGKEMTLQIINKLRLSNYESYLHMGEARVRTALEDVRTLESLPGNFIVFFNSIIMILAGIGYMFWLYPKGAIMMIFLILILVFIYIHRNGIIEKDMDAKRDLDDVFMRNYNDFLHGFNKVKMSTKRSDSIFLDHITKNRDKAIKLSIKSGLSAFGNELLGDYFFYLLIGTVLFILPTFFSIDATVISGFMITLLFLMGPIAILINLMESIISYKVAFKRINEFNDTLTDNFNDSDSILLSTSKELPVFETLYTNNIDYQHIDEKGNITFQLKPINLKINKGEVVFISGSNGSGKSTFINLLSGLYIPKSGEIFVNDVLITNNNRSNYRDMISCIFADNYLFTENYDNFDLLPSNTHLTKLLKEMKLDEIIRQDIANNRIFQNLSSGQQKRLALIYSVLEDKDIFIFDEWAAEQDPEFRKYFYENIIPDLKSKGKTVIAITHDDAYYKYCDRLIKFDYGKMIEKDTVTFSSY